MRKFLMPFAASLLLSVSVFAQPGTLDPTFSSDGIQLVNPTNVFDNAQDVLVFSDNKILLCGTTGNALDFDVMVVKLNEDGSYDSSFGNNGLLTLPNALGSDFAYDMDVLPNGNIIVVGAKSLTMADTEFAAWSIKPDGTLDPNFATNGVYETNLDSGEEYINQAVIHNNLIYLVGRKYTPGFSYTSIAVQCIDLQGNLVTTFGVNGTAIFQSSNTDEFNVTGATFVTEGAIAICGDKYNPNTFGSVPMIMLMNLNGGPVAAFGNNGLWLDASGGSYYDIEYSNSKLIASGTNGSSAMARRHNLDGSLDTSFGNNGSFTNAVGGYSVFYDCMLGADNNWYACGTTSSGFMVRDFLTARFTIDGVLETTWGGTGNVVTSLGDSFDDAYGIGMQVDGKVVCAGLTMQNPNDMGIVRYLANVISHVEENYAFELSVFPNPSQSEIYLNSARSGYGTMRISDMAGRVAIQQKMAISLNQRIDVSSLPAGIYSITVELENKQSVISFVKL